MDTPLLRSLTSFLYRRIYMHLFTTIEKYPQWASDLWLLLPNKVSDFHLLLQAPELGHSRPWQKVTHNLHPTQCGPLNQVPSHTSQPNNYKHSFDSVYLLITIGYVPHSYQQYPQNPSQFPPGPTHQAVYPHHCYPPPESEYPPQKSRNEYLLTGRFK